MVSTLDFESSDPSSNLGGTYIFTLFFLLPFFVFLLLFFGFFLWGFIDFRLFESSFFILNYKNENETQQVLDYKENLDFNLPFSLALLSSIWSKQHLNTLQDNVLEHNSIPKIRFRRGHIHCCPDLCKSLDHQNLPHTNQFFHCLHKYFDDVGHKTTNPWLASALILNILWL